MTDRLFRLLTAFILLLSAPIYAQFSFGTYAIDQVNLIDVDQGKILENQTVVVYGDRIEGIFHSDEYVKPDSVQILNFKGKYLIPGLIDAHVHMATDASSEIRANSEKVLMDMLRTGVTSVRDMAGDARALSSLSRDALVEDINAPDVHYSSLMAGTEFFSDPRTIATARGGKSGQMPYMKAIDKDTDLVLAVAEARGTGAAGIKLYASLETEQVIAIVKEARRQGILVWSHGSLLPAKPSEVISSGVVSISHSYMLVHEFFPSNEEVPEAWLEEEALTKKADYWEAEYKKLNMEKLLILMKENDVVLDATLSVFEKFKDYLKYRWRYEMNKRITRDANRLGVKVAAGCDSDQETFVQHEMMLMAEECGFSPLEALVSATKYSAQASGVLEEEGSIRVGKKANLVLLNSNPIKDLKNMKEVELVIKNGKLFNSK